jgi:hypothetical protein
LKIAQRLHAQTGRNFVVRQEKEVGQGGFTELPQEIACAAGCDRHNRRLRLLDASRNAIEDFTNLLRRKGKMTVLFAVLDGGFHRLLDRRVEEPGRQLARPVQIRLDHGAADGLPHILGQQHGIARGTAGLAERLQNRDRVADRNPLPQQVL